MLPWTLCTIFFSLFLFAVIKILIMRKSLDEIHSKFDECLNNDTNMLVTVSSSDRHICVLANKINQELKILQKKRIQYQAGDQELKEAIINISHDLRTPLTAISGYLELLEKEEKNEKVRSYLSYIENRTNAMKELTEELFRYTITLSSEKLVLSSVDVRATLEKCLLSFYAAFEERGIIPEIELTEKKIKCIANESALSRVFSNILSNVLKYSDGDLKVSMNEDGEVCFNNQAKSLDEVSVGKLFNRFFTVENAHNSTGLGLAIAKSLVEQMRGEIRAEFHENRISIYIKFSSEKI